MIVKFQNLLNCYPWVRKYYSTEYWKTIYRENVEPLRDLSEWEHPKEMIVVLPPSMEHRHSDRPFEYNRRPSQGEEVH